MMQEDSPPQVAVRPQRRKVLEGDLRVPLVVEGLCLGICLFFHVALFVASVTRPGYISLIYLLIFLFTLAFPSKYDYYHKTRPVLLGQREHISVTYWLNRNVLCTPRLPIAVLSLALSLAFGITQLVMQCVLIFTEAKFYNDPKIRSLLHDIGIVKITTSTPLKIVLTLLPEALLLPVSLFTVIFLATIIGQRKKYDNWKRNSFDGNPINGEDITKIEQAEDVTTHYQSVAENEIVKPSSSSLLAPPAVTGSSSSSSPAVTPASETEVSLIQHEPLPSPSIQNWKIFIVFAAVMLAASAKPALISIFYFFSFFVALSAFLVNIKPISAVIFSVFAFTGLYSGVLLLVLSLSRLEALVVMQKNFWAQMVGFSDLMNFTFDIWPSYLFIAALFAVYILTCTYCNQYLMDMIEFRKSGSAHSAAKFAKKEPSAASKVASTVMAKILSYTPILLLFAFLIMAVSAPSVLAMVYLVLMYMGILVPMRIFSKVLPLALLYNFFFTGALFAMNIPGVVSFVKPSDMEILHKVGLRYEPYYTFVFLGLMFLAFLITAQFRISMMPESDESQKAKAPVEATQLFTATAEQKSYYYQNADTQPPSVAPVVATVSQVLIQDSATEPESSYQPPATTAIAEPTKVELAPPESKAKQGNWEALAYGIVRVFKAIYEFLRISARITVNLTVSYSYYVALLVLYVADLTSDYADIIHLIYLLFFIAFFVFRSLAQKAWFLLVLYTQAVITCLYIFNLWWPQQTGTLYKLFGLVQFKDTSFWGGLITHICILIFTGIEFHILNTKELGGISIDKNTHESDLKKLPKFILFIARGIYSLFQNLGTIVFFFVILLLILISVKVSMINLIFLIFFCICATIYSMFPKNGWKIVYPIWYVLVLFCGIAFFAAYSYQFPIISEWFEEALDNLSSRYRLFITPDSIGLEKYGYKPLGLLPATIVLLLGLLVLKDFQFRVLGGGNSEGQEVTSFETKYVHMIIRYAKRISILHTPKLVLIMLFITAQVNPSMIGLVYFLATILFAPIPAIASKIWFFILFYSQIVMLAQYFYQFPYFVANMDCKTPFQPSIANEFCKWFDWVGLKNMRSSIQYDPAGAPVGPLPKIASIIIEHLLVVVICAFQRRCFEWRNELIAQGKFQDGILFPETFDNTERSTLPESGWLNSIRNHELYIAVKKRLKTFFNHFFDQYGFEISLFALFFGSLVLIDNVWGLLYLLLFGICLFVGKQKIIKGWMFIVLGMELNLFIVYIISMNPFPYFNLVETLTKWKFSFIFNYIVIKISDQTIFFMIYLILFLMAQESRVIFEKRHLFKQSDKDPTEIIAEEQRKLGKLHVPVDISKHANGLTDFTSPEQQRLIIPQLKLLTYQVFPYVCLIMVFIDTAIFPSLLKLAQLTLCLVYLNYSEQLIWRGKRFWIYMGVFFYVGLVLQSIYQIPLVLFGPSTGWDVPHYIPKLLSVLGLGKMQLGNYWLDVLILVMYYLQEKLFESKDYLFFTNYLYRAKTQRLKMLARNNVFRAAKLLKVFVQRAKIAGRQKNSMGALREYKSKYQASDNLQDKKAFVKEYRQIHESAKTEESNQANLTMEFKEAVNMVLACPGLENMDKKLLFRIIQQSNTTRDMLKIILLHDREEEDRRARASPVVTTPAHHEIKDQIVDELLKKERQESEVEKLQEKQRFSQSFRNRSSSTHALPPLEILQRGSLTAEQRQACDPVAIVENHQAPVTHAQPEANLLVTAPETAQVQPTEVTEEPIQEVPLEEEEVPATTQEKISTFANTMFNYIIQAVNFVTVLVEKFISIAYDIESGVVEIKPGSSEPEIKVLMVRNSFVRMGNALKYFYLSNTDVFCYILFVLNFMLSPTFYNTLFTITAFGFAAMQYPVPHKYYWSFVLFATQLFTALEYIFVLIQSANKSDTTVSDVDKGYSPLEITGWRPASTLVNDIIFYLIITLVVVHHRSTLKTRGDWDYYSQASINQVDAQIKKAEKQRKKTMKEQAALKAAAEGKTSPEDHPVVPTVEEVEDHDEKLHAATYRVTEIASNTKTFLIRHFKTVFLDSTFKVGADFYVIMVLVEIAFYAVFFLTYQFLIGRPTDDITGAIRYNELDGIFVVMLILFFLVIVLDRIIYIYTSIRAKAMLQFFIIIVYHSIYLFSYHRQREYNNIWGLVVLNALFAIKCVYLWISALQISRGYTKDSYIFFFANKFHWIQYTLYSVWRAIPFVFELKTLLDWTFIKTTLRFYDWIKLEDINAALYRRKCDITYLEGMGRKVGDPQTASTKFGSGFILFVVITGIIFFPLFFYSTANPTFEFNTISKVSVTISINGYENFYANQLLYTTPDAIKINQYTYDEYFANMPSATAKDAFRDFNSQMDIQNFTLNTWSEQYWLISPPSRQSLIGALSERKIQMTYTVERKGPMSSKIVTDTQYLELTAEQQATMAGMIRGDVASGVIVFRQAYNPYITNKASGIKPADNVNQTYWPDCTFGIRSTDFPTQSLNLFWWTMNCTQQSFRRNEPPKQITGPYFHIQSTKISGENAIASVLSSFGIIAFYTTFVLAVGRFFRTYVSDVIGRIFYEDLDDVDLLISYVQDIYLARAYGDLVLEETMYNQLIVVFRDPHLLSIWTKPKVE